MTLRMRKADKNQVLEILKSVTGDIYKQSAHWWKVNIPVLCFHCYWLHSSCTTLLNQERFLHLARIFSEWTGAIPNHQELLRWFWRSILRSLYQDASISRYRNGRRNQGAYQKWSKAAWWTAWNSPALLEQLQRTWVVKPVFFRRRSRRASYLWNDHEFLSGHNPSCHQATLCRSPDAGTSNRFRPLTA